MDLDMSSNSYSAHLKELIESGEIPESILDEAVEDVLRIKFELGLFEHPYQTNETHAFTEQGTPLISLNAGMTALAPASIHAL